MMRVKPEKAKSELKKEWQRKGKDTWRKGS